MTQLLKAVQQQQQASGCFTGRFTGPSSLYCCGSALSSIIYIASIASTACIVVITPLVFPSAVWYLGMGEAVPWDIGIFGSLGID